MPADWTRATYRTTASWSPPDSLGVNHISSLGWRWWKWSRCFRSRPLVSSRQPPGPCLLQEGVSCCRVHWQVQRPAAPFITESRSTAGWDGRLVIQLVILTRPTRPLCGISFLAGGRWSLTRLRSARELRFVEVVFGDKQTEQNWESPPWRSKTSLQTALSSEPEKVRVPWTWTSNTFLISSGRFTLNNNNVWVSAEQDAALSWVVF